MQMSNVRSCPECQQAVDIIAINREVEEKNKTFYFINCQTCGFGTQEAYPTKELLIEKWNEALEPETVCC